MHVEVDRSLARWNAKKLQTSNVVLVVVVDVEDDGKSGCRNIWSRSRQTIGHPSWLLRLRSLIAQCPTS